MSFVSLKDIMLLLLVLRRSMFEEGSSVNGLSLGVHLVWLSCCLVIPLWVISPFLVVIWNRWLVWFQSMPHGITIECFAGENFAVFSGGDFLPQSTWFLEVDGVIFAGLFACAGATVGVFCPNHLDFLNFPFEVRDCPLHQLQYGSCDLSHSRRDYENMSKKGFLH
jgi:hypothetical protein